MQLNIRIISVHTHVVRHYSNFEEFKKHFLAKEINPFLIRANFVNVQIDGVIYRGWLGDCPFQAGEEVTVIAQWQ